MLTVYISHARLSFCLQLTHKKKRKTLCRKGQKSGLTFRKFVQHLVATSDGNLIPSLSKAHSKPTDEPPSFLYSTRKSWPCMCTCKAYCNTLLQKHLATEGNYAEHNEADRPQPYRKKTCSHSLWVFPTLPSLASWVKCNYALGAWQYCNTLCSSYQ